MKTYLQDVNFQSPQEEGLHYPLSLVNALRLVLSLVALIRFLERKTEHCNGRQTSSNFAHNKLKRIFTMLIN